MQYTESPDFSIMQVEVSSILLVVHLLDRAYFADLLGTLIALQFASFSERASHPKLSIPMNGVGLSPWIPLVV